MSKIISIVIIQAVISFTFFPLSYSDNNLIETTCKKTPFFDLCVSTLKSDPRSSTADVAGLALIAADSVKAKALATLNQVTGLIKSATDPKLLKALNHCFDSYNNILQVDIAAAIQAIVKRDSKFAVNSATDAANKAQGCDNGFANPPKSPISNGNKAVHDLSVVLESIAKLF
ncbi:cell wall / vacuolar inhibitor of fructosidase 1-like [Durio zibethinus]|uniref:Cell wall / vacuolar inhibitor of fructosidase 1-like n=1 Tax=Durio zibethinus TaxID=66656 RepID=A0A6P6A7N5_DURZI|nr:cell wall / vacuolar inhibitor of fructosidase 1-like [Durio zibethinus]